MAVMSKAEWLRRRRRKVYILRIIVFSVLLLIVAGVVFGVVSLCRTLFLHEKLGTITSAGDTEVLTRFLEKSQYSRNGVRIAKKNVKGVVIHCTDSPGVSAMEQRNYYNSLGTTRAASLSMHFIVDLDGKVIQCIPVNEQALANGPRNGDTLAVEFCWESETGEPGKFTYSSLVKLSATLLNRFKLGTECLYRHSDITGYDEINCPKGFSDNSVWNTFKEDVAAQMVLLKKK